MSTIYNNITTNRYARGKKAAKTSRQKKWNHIKERVRKREDVDSYWTLPLSAVMHWDLQ